MVSSSEGSTEGVSYRLGIGLATNAGSLKGFTVGGHGGNSWGSSDVAVILEDLDGDGLPDKVFKTKNPHYLHNEGLIVKLASTYSPRF